MATLVFSALGTVFGGPLGGALGALAGQQIDSAIFGAPRREGPRLKELNVTTSSYGSPIPSHHGRMRVAGSIIWATPLTESSESTGGGKGQPSQTSFSYSVSFAVALSSRPIKEIRRIWADGNLLRGNAGDLKVGGTLRFYDGHGDHALDPLIASAEGSAVPAFRNIAYVVFEDLQLSDFGNRIPALTFEIVADDGDVSLANLLADVDTPKSVSVALQNLSGFSHEEGPIVQTLSTLDSVYPVAIDAGGDMLTIRSAEQVPTDPPWLPAAAAAQDDDSFGKTSGSQSSRSAGSASVPDSIRYYDLDRDFQAGLQRADGRALPGRSGTIQFPGALSANTARALTNAAAERASWSRETLSWRIAELDPDIAPGSIVRVPGQPGNWRIESWELLNQGVELELVRLPRGPARRPVADAGKVASPPDRTNAPTQLQAFELPWDGKGASDQQRIFAAASSSSDGWTGAALYAANQSDLTPLGGTGSQRSILGQSTTQLGSSQANILDRHTSIEIELAAEDFTLQPASIGDLANGANKAVLGQELIQFSRAEKIGPRLWRLSGLLRGRGGTELAAHNGHDAGTPFTLLDSRPIALDPALVGTNPATTIAALGLADPGVVTAPIGNRGSTLKPLAPVHARANFGASGDLHLSWIRRARGAWDWLDEVDAPIVEQSLAFQVGLGPQQSPAFVWEVSESQLLIPAIVLAEVQLTMPTGIIWVRQIGSHALSAPTHLITLSQT